MGVRDVAGVFSRYFVVGFFLPVFFAGAALDQETGGYWLPAEYQDAPGTRLLIIGGLALLVGLLLTGLHQSLLSVLSGEALWPESVRRVLVNHHRHRYHNLAHLMEKGDPTQRTAAARLVTRKYPANPEAIGPTRLGNARGAAEWQTRQRWSLDSTFAWPRIELLLDQQQAGSVADARADLAFLVNGSIMSLGVVPGIALAPLDETAIGPGLAMLVALVVARTLYLLAVQAALRLGADVQAPAIDLHRLTLYRRLGFRPPATDEEDRRVGLAANRLLAFGVATPDVLRAAADETMKDDPPGADG